MTATTAITLKREGPGFGEAQRSSEGLNPDTDAFDPDLAEVDYDDEAMAEAVGRDGR